MARTTDATTTTAAPTVAANASPIVAASATATRASVTETAPDGMGFVGRPASAGASTMSIRAPMANWSDIIDSPSSAEVARSPPATRATAETTRPSRTDGNGWTSRTSPATRAARPSDVDELVEVLDEVVDEAIAPVRRFPADTRHEGIQRDRRYDLMTLRVPAERCHRPAAGSEHPFAIGLAQVCRLPEVGEDTDDATTLGDVAHHLRRPRVDLIVRLIGETLTVFLRIGRKACPCHGAPCLAFGRPSMPDGQRLAPVRRPRRGARRVPRGPQSARPTRPRAIPRATH